MVSLPLVRSLDVTEYGLYPGEDPNNPGLHIRFNPGLTLVLGANGLGKTTLVTMLYRLLAGPSDIPILMGQADIGNASLRVTTLRGNNRRIFAQRVADNAGQASARLAFDLGGQQIVVERNLKDLSLRSFTVDESASSQDESHYQRQIVKLTGVSTFGDWILLLRYIVFYFEDRRSLVWDPSAQRHLLRILFLKADQGRFWTEREREILEIDTRMRNIRAVATSEEHILAQEEASVIKEPDLKDELGALQQKQQIDTDSLGELQGGLSDIEAHHESARLRYLTLEQQRESKYRELENAQLLAVSARLPRHSDSARYIFAQLLSEAKCLVCGNEVPSLVESMESRIHSNECVVCGSNMTPSGNPIPVNIANEMIRQNSTALEAIDTELNAARSTLEDAENERQQVVTEIQKLRTSLAEVRARMELVTRQLPPEESRLHLRQQELASLRGRIELLQRDLVDKRTSFEQIIADANAQIEQQALKVQASFSDYAKEFLLEDCRLVWSPIPARLGQTGPRFDFPAFGLELGGSDFESTVRRSGPDEVSESQREFIDISFRMALVKVAAQEETTSLVMDAPESSLDAVFVDRAARILGTFGKPETGNRLVLTLNLVAGRLIPSLLAQTSTSEDRDERVVDLLVEAAPTAALRSLKDEYQEAKARLLNEADSLENETEL